MKIRPKNIIYAASGVKFSLENAGGKNWRQQVFENYRQHLLDQLAAYGLDDAYGLWLNEMQNRHAQIYHKAGNNWETIAYQDPEVGKYQHDYRGSQRNGTVKIKDSDKYDFNQTGIKPNQKIRYNIEGVRTSGDYQRDSYNYNPDNLYSAITDDRRLLGREGDWTKEDLEKFNEELKQRGWRIELDPSDKYYKLHRLKEDYNPSLEQRKPFDQLPFPEAKEIPLQEPIKMNLDPKNLKPLDLGDEIPAGTSDKKNFWQNLKGAATKLLNNPDLFATVRLAGQLVNNNRIYDEALKGIRPELMQSYHTHRQVVGDEATKQVYYRRAAQGQTKAAQPFTSDADRQMAYQYEAKRIGDELRAQGDLVDNQEIRRTSDESNQHQWANTQRDTEVANANMKSLVQTNALRHNLLAQKHAAQWTSIDNYLLGLENEKRQKNAENKAINDSIYQLTRAGEIENDPTLLDIRERIDAASKKPENQKTDSYGTKVVNWDSKKMRGLLAEKKSRERQLQIETLQELLQKRNNNLWFLKSGAKITHKRKDDLLYKTARDNAEHFRKMSKMSSDAQDRKKPKIEKLAPHPKGRTRKYQQGGLAPFGVYRPAALGGETTTTSQIHTSGTSDRASSGKDTQKNDLLKELFKALQLEGIPSDVNAIFSSINSLMEKRRAFGEELTTEDITAAYLQSMHQINNVKFNKAQFDIAQKIVNDKNASSEFAIDQSGRVVVQNIETKKIELVKPTELNFSKHNPLTNQDLLRLRTYSEPFDNSFLEIAGNATSMQEIAAFLKAQLPKIESTEIEGYTKKDANLIKEGIQVLKDAPNGEYKFNEKSNLKQAEKALEYLYNILPGNMKALLDAKTGGKSGQLIAQLISSQQSYSFNLDAVTGKASKDSESTDKIKSNPLLAMQREIGGSPTNYSIITRDSNTMLSVDGTGYPTLHKVTKDMSIEEMLAVSGIGQIVLSKSGITFGDQRIDPENLKDIMYSNTGRNAIVTLPCKIVNGSKQVNLDIIREYEEAEEKALQVAERGTEQFEKVLGQKLKEAHLDSLLTSDGRPNKKMFSEFLIVEGYTTDKIPIENKKSQYIEKVNNPDSGLEQRIIKALSTDSKNSNYAIDVKDKFALFELTYDDVYRGTIFIPISNNPAAALLNDSVNVQQSTELEELYQISNKSNKYVKDNSF